MRGKAKSDAGGRAALKQKPFKQFVLFVSTI